MSWKSSDKTAMDFKNISELLSWWLIICCIHSHHSKSHQTKLTPALFFCSSIFFRGSLPTFLFASHVSFCLPLFFFCFFCLIMTVHHNALLSGNCHSHYLFNLSLHICQILKCITALQNINCLLSINRLARRSQAEIQLCLCSVWVKCGAGYHRIWIIHACSGSVRVF